MIPGLIALAGAHQGVPVVSDVVPRVAVAPLPANAGNLLLSVPDWDEPVLGALTLVSPGTVDGTLISDAEIGVGLCDGAAEYAHSLCARDGLQGGAYQADTNVRTSAGTLNTQATVTEASILGSSSRLGAGSAEYFVSPRNHDGTVISSLWPWPCKAVAVADASAHTVDMGGDYDLYLFVGTANTSVDQSRLTIRSSIGACNRGLDRGCVALMSIEPTTPTVHAAWASSAAVAARLSGGSVVARDVTALPPGGITLGAGSSDYLLIMGLQTGGRQVDVRMVTLPTSTGAMLSGLPGTPVWTMVIGSSLTALDTVVAATAWSLGVGVTDYQTERGTACRTRAAVATPSAQSRLAPFLRYDGHDGAALVDISGMTATADGATCTVTSGAAVLALSISVI